MNIDPAIVRGVRSAVAADPQNAALRLHLAALLLDSGDPREALSECQAVLAPQPDHQEALAMALKAADALGDPEHAARYRRLLAALGDADSETPPTASGSGDTPWPAPVDVPAVPVGDIPSVGDQIDVFLSDLLGGEEVERPALTLGDVGGMEQVKRRLQTSFLGPMRNPELRRMYGKSLGGGLLLYGPPGCGKTFLARAVAGELEAHFFAVGLHDVLDMWLGKSEQNLHGVFETARRHVPCVLFLDEIDALGFKRSNLTFSAGRNVVVQLLSELDSTRSDNDGLFVLAATNQPWDVDPALRRPGRLDRMLLVLPPDRPAREVIIDYHLRGRPLVDVDVGRLAAGTERYSGADLRLVCESAAEMALEESVASGQARPIGMADLERAVADIRPSTLPWFDVARNYAMFANEGGMYDDLLAYIRANKMG